MTRWVSALSLLSLALFWTNLGRADPLEYIGKPVRGIPVSSAVKVGKSLFVSGMPAFDASGKLAIGDFPAQMKQVMDNLTGLLKDAGADWSRVVKTNVLLTRASDFAEMNRIFPGWKVSSSHNGDRRGAATSGFPSRDRMRGAPAIVRSSHRIHLLGLSSPSSNRRFSAQSRLANLSASVENACPWSILCGIERVVVA